MAYTILYVEDEFAIVELISEILEHPEVNFQMSLTAEGGLRKARAIRPDLIILDVLMPIRDGWSIYNEIRADEVLKQTPIIMLTGQMHRYYVVKQFEKSAIDAYITKPFNASTVRDEVEKMLGVTLWSRSSTPLLPAADQTQDGDRPDNDVKQSRPV